MDYDNEEEHQESCGDDRDTPAGLSFGSTSASLSFGSTSASLGFGSTPASHGFGSTPGCHDKEGQPLITIVDRSGIHEIGVSWCCCPEAPEHDIQLMMAGLFPATFRNPKTAFTFRVLEEFHLDNLECKTTPSQFFSCLRRLTNEEFPNVVPVR